MAAPAPIRNRVYALGAVKPWVKDAAYEIGNHFSVATILGVGLRPTTGSDHPRGLALDFMVGMNRARGDAIASYVQSNAKRLGVTYVIWKQRIWNADRAQDGWRSMSDRGSATANHFDHVHVSFTADGKGTGGGGIDLIPDLPNPLAPIMPVVDAVQWLMDKRNLLRIAMFLGGTVLLVIALLGWAAVSSGVTGALKGKIT